MDFLLHRQKFRGHVMKMPQGLQEIMADISREVLRRQPLEVCTYKFIADYLNAMLKAREEAFAVKGILQTALCRVFEAIPKLQSLGIPVEKSHSAECLMEKSFMHLVERKRHLIGDDKGLAIYESDLLDQLILLCKFSHDEAKRSRPVIQAAFKDFLASYLNAVQDKTDQLMMRDPLLQGTIRSKLCNLPSAERKEVAAVIIQSNYKGYKTRKDMLLGKMATGREPTYKCLDKSGAAENIAKLYRGYETRKVLTNNLECAPASLQMEEQTQANLLQEIRKEICGHEFQKELDRRLKALAPAIVEQKQDEQNIDMEIEKMLASTDDFFNDDASFNKIRDRIGDGEESSKGDETERLYTEDDLITLGVTSSRLSMDEFLPEEETSAYGMYREQIKDFAEDMTEDEDEDDWRELVATEGDVGLTDIQVEEPHEVQEEAVDEPVQIEEPQEVVQDEPQLDIVQEEPQVEVVQEQNQVEGVQEQPQEEATANEPPPEHEGGAEE